MLKRLRLGSKDAGRQSSVETGATGFLHLPAELRNAIYELIVADSTLTMVPGKAKRAPPPAMLLVSRQVRVEYQPILLTQAPMIANVVNYDFRDISNMALSLYSVQLKCMRMNKNLIIRLKCQRCRNEDTASLRRWLVQKAEPLDRLPWRYEIGWSGVKCTQAAKHDMLANHLKLLSEMRVRLKLDERLHWELLPILDTIQHEMDMIEGGK